VRLRITQKPTVRELDGVRLDRYVVGLVYDLSTSIANVLLAEGWAEPVGPDEPALVVPQQQRRAVLVVEDDYDMRTIAVEILSSKGYPVFAAQNGREALALLRQHRPAVVLLDLMMPVMNGWEFRHEQLRTGDSTPVVLLTAVPNAREEARTLGAADVIEKPLHDFEILVEKLRRWLKP
jgi:CheY-like chemotaxis protein